MTFSRRLRSLAVLVPAVTAALGSLVFGVPSAAADDLVLHHVKYTVFTEVPFRNAEIYYRNVDPENYAEYSHNPYVFSPNVEADLGPNQMWTIDVMLADPNQWAMVTATSLAHTGSTSRGTALVDVQPAAQADAEVPTGFRSPSRRRSHSTQKASISVCPNEIPSSRSMTSTWETLVANTAHTTGGTSATS